jgi:hypothetical protein
MTRGPPPKKAIDLALKIAKGQGDVRDAAGISGFRCDFMIFLAFVTIYVRVKRVYAVVRDPGEIAREFAEAVRQIRAVPQTAATSRQIWVVTPWDTVQYFLVLDDRIIEINADGMPVPVGGPAPAIDPVGLAPVSGGRFPVAVAGFTCPFFGKPPG